MSLKNLAVIAVVNIVFSVCASSYNCVSLNSTFMEISRGYATAGDYNQALQIISNIKHPHIRIYLLTEIAHKTFKTGN
ncbi:MAG: hypothetical protein WBB28_00840 [Crinalium sp.]